MCIIIPTMYVGTDGMTQRHDTSFFFRDLGHMALLLIWHFKGHEMSNMPNVI